MTAAAAGAYYKRRTKKWLEDRGFAVAYMERVQLIPGKDGRPTIPVKRDQFGADLLAMKRDTMALVQVKFQRTESSTAAARRTFDQFPIPPFVQTWIVVWAPRQRAPEIQSYVFSRGATDGETNECEICREPAGEGGALCPACAAHAAPRPSRRVTRH